MLFKQLRENLRPTHDIRQSSSPAIPLRNLNDGNFYVVDNIRSKHVAACSVPHISIIDSLSIMSFDVPVQHKRTGVEKDPEEKKCLMPLSYDTNQQKVEFFPFRLHVISLGQVIFVLMGRFFPYNGSLTYTIIFYLIEDAYRERVSISSKAVQYK